MPFCSGSTGASPDSRKWWLWNDRFWPKTTSITDGGSVGGDRKLKERTPRLAPGRPQPPIMGFDNRAADREAHAHAVGLRRVEGFKEPREALRAQPRAGIPHRDAHATLGRNGIDADL